MEIKVRVQDKDTVRYLRQLPISINKKIIEGVNEAGKRLTRYVKSKYLRTQGENSLGRDSGELFRSTRPIVAKKINDNIVTGGTEIGASSVANIYVRTHVSSRPKTTIIYPRTAKMLAIPLPPARIGGRRIKPRELPNSFFRGNVLVSSFLGDEFVPFFVMKRFVSIKSRVHTKKIANEFRPVITKTIDDSIKASVRE